MNRSSNEKFKTFMVSSQLLVFPHSTMLLPSSQDCATQPPGGGLFPVAYIAIHS